MRVSIHEDTSDGRLLWDDAPTLPALNDSVLLRAADGGEDWWHVYAVVHVPETGAVRVLVKRKGSLDKGWTEDGVLRDIEQHLANHTAYGCMQMLTDVARNPGISLRIRSRAAAAVSTVANWLTQAVTAPDSQSGGTPASSSH